MTETTRYDDDLYEQARVAWEPICASRAGFLQRLTSLRKQFPDARLAIDDLYLVSAVLENDGQALRELDRLVDRAARSLFHLQLPAADWDDIIQALKTELLLATGGAGTLGQYRALAPLSAWIKVALTRRAVDRKRVQPNANGDDEEDILLGISGETTGVEIKILREKYRGVFRRSVEHAVSQLDPADRLLLKQHHIDGLSLDELARQHAVHRATIARRLKSAREAILDSTRAGVASAAGIDKSEVEGVMKAIQSQLDVSFHRILS